MDSKQMVDALLEVDPGFEQLCKTLFGDLVEPADVWDFMYEQDGISKALPKKVTNVLKPLGIGVAGGIAANQLPQNQGKWPGAKKVEKAMPDQADLAKQGGRFMRVIRRHGPAATVGAGVGAGGVALAKRPDKPAQFVRLDRTGSHVLKSDNMDVVWEGTFSKTDDERRQAFGWASVVEVDGKPVIDRQGDWITPDEIEKAAYKYVLENRKGGNQHKRDDSDQPLHASSLIESFVVTPEKIEKMGLPKETPVGWWVGYQVHDEDAWQDIKKGVRTGFSIHGRGKRRDVEE
jgi:Putative phage serine protease XkdF